MAGSGHNSIAAERVRSFVERIVRLKEEVRALNGDVREVYAEAKSAGFDKTVLGKVVNYVEKRSADADKVAESDALFGLYLEAYDGTPAKTGTPIALRAHTHEAASPPVPTPPPSAASTPASPQGAAEADGAPVASKGQAPRSAFYRDTLPFDEQLDCDWWPRDPEAPANRIHPVDLALRLHDAGRGDEADPDFLADGLGARANGLIAGPVMNLEAAE